jgi:ferredoxin
MKEEVFINSTIAGPVSVYVKDGKIFRIRPLQVDKADLKPWTITDPKGGAYSPPRDIDPAKAKGRKEILDSCPYNAIFWNEELSLPQKCTMCAHLLDQGWEKPRCVEVCPTKALLFGDFNDPESEVCRRLREAGEDAAVSLHPEYGLTERVRYLDLPKRFVAGSVVLGDSDRCARSVTVTLTGDGHSRETSTNGFGDFEFEGLDKDKRYTLTFSRPGYQTREVKVFTKIDKHIGDVVLSRS